MKNRKRIAVLLVILCLCFATAFATGCSLKTKDSSNGENTWSDANVDDGGWI